MEINHLLKAGFGRRGFLSGSSLLLTGALLGATEEARGAETVALLARRARGVQLALINGAPIDTSGPTIFEAIRQQLGLKLERQKGPVDIMVLDHAERPVEN